VLDYKHKVCEKGGDVVKIDPELRGEIYKKYSSIAAMARKLGWSRPRLHNALCNPTHQRADNISKILEAIGADDDMSLLRFFMPVKSTKD